MSKKEATTFDFGFGPVPAHRHENPPGHDSRVGGWIAETARVAPSAYVADTALVYENARVGDQVRIHGDARVYGAAGLMDAALVFTGSRICEKAIVGDNAKIRGAWIYGQARIFGNAEVSAPARVGGKACLLGSMVIRSGSWTRTPLYIEGTRYRVAMVAPQLLSIGCVTRSLREWLEKGEEINLEQDRFERLTLREIEEYRDYVLLAAKRYAPKLYQRWQAQQAKKKTPRARSRK